MALSSKHILATEENAVHFAVIIKCHLLMILSIYGNVQLSGFQKGASQT